MLCPLEELVCVVHDTASRIKDGRRARTGCFREAARKILHPAEAGFRMTQGLFQKALSLIDDINVDS